MRALLGIVLLAPLLAGCLQPAAQVALPASLVDGLGVLSWDGSELTAPKRYPSPDVLARCLVDEGCATPKGECGETNCEKRAFDVVVPPGFEGQLAVALRWPTDHELWFTLDVLDPDGKLVAEGEYTPVDHLSALALVDTPRSGTYTAVVMLMYGTSSTYEAAARLLPVPPREGALLPDLVTLQPTDLRVEDPPAVTTAYMGLVPTGPFQPAMRAAGVKGCGVDEALDGARRCLRFSNAVGNAGAGPLDILLPAGATSFTQRVWSADGTFEDRAAGKAEFHAVHGHFHNAAASVFTIYALDAPDAPRGEAVTEGRKTGICFADIGLVALDAERMALPDYHGIRCINPATERGWHMGLSVGWFDLYDWVVPDQYVDITGVEDGLYELCAHANPDAVLVESDASNNEGCTRFRLTGDDVEVLVAEPYHKWPAK